MRRRDFLRVSTIGTVGFLACRTAGGEDDPWLPYLTPADEFFESKHSEEYPGPLALDDWRLCIDGALERPLELAWRDLDALRREHEVTTIAALNCVSDLPGQPPFLSQGLWTGVPLRPLLERARLLPEAQRVIAAGRDRAFRSNLHLTWIRNDDPAPVLLAYSLNGAPLSLQRGQPIRLLAPGRYGFKSIKWLERLEVSVAAEPVGDYETQDDPRIDDEARMLIKAKVLRPGRSVRLAAGDIWVLGYAVSGSEPVASVEVAVDDGPWQAAELAGWEQVRAEAVPAARVQAGPAYPFPYTWVPWRYLWRGPQKGRHRLRCRATDTAGNVMPDVDDHYADGTNGVDLVKVRIR